MFDRIDCNDCVFTVKRQKSDNCSCCQVPHQLYVGGALHPVLKSLHSLPVCECIDF